jgi:hypothetical protein
MIGGLIALIGVFIIMFWPRTWLSLIYPFDTPINLCTTSWGQRLEILGKLVTEKVRNLIIIPRSCFSKYFNPPIVRKERFDIR